MRASEKLHKRFYADNPERQAGLEKARESLRIAREAYELRTAAGLTQRQLARRLGVFTIAIAALEEDCFTGDAAALLREIREALK